MGGASSRVDSQFDSSFSSHGVTAPLKGSTDSHRGGVDRDVEAAHDPSVPYDGDGSRDVLSSGNGQSIEPRAIFQRKRSMFKQLGDANNFCIHPAARVLKRGNQYANWTVCGVCGSRLTYKSKDRMTPSRAASKGSTQGSCIDFNDSVANTSTDMGTPEHPRISRSSGTAMLVGVRRREPAHPADHFQ